MLNHLRSPSVETPIRLQALKAYFQPSFSPHNDNTYRQHSISSTFSRIHIETSIIDNETLRKKHESVYFGDKGRTVRINIAKSLQYRSPMKIKYLRTWSDHKAVVIFLAKDK